MIDRTPASGVVLAVCGLAFEARIATSAHVRTVVGGGRSTALADAIEREVARGVIGIVSFGVAGALTIAMRPGTLIVAEAIIGPQAGYPVDVAWSRALVRRVPRALHATIAGRDDLAADTASKRALHDATGADAVDMESHVAARIAAAHRLPFVALRAIADPLERSLPPAATIAMREDGGLDLPAVFASIVRGPRQLGTLLRIGLDTRTALRALRDGRRLLGDGLGHPDLDHLLLDVV